MLNIIIKFCHCLLLLKIFFKTAIICTMLAMAQGSNGSTPEKSKFRFIKSLWKGICQALATLLQVMKSAPHLILVHIFAGALTAAYQGLCLLIIPFLFAIRRLLNIQLALYVAATEGE